MADVSTTTRSAFPTRVLLAFSDPILRLDLTANQYQAIPALERLDLTTELPDILEALSWPEPTRHYAVDLLPLRFDTARSLFRRTLSHYHILVVRCHGRRDPDGTYLMFEDTHGVATPFSLEEFTACLQDIRRPADVVTHLAVFGACHSASFAEALAKEHVPHVIAVHAPDTILRKTLQIFLRSFFHHTNHEAPVIDAFASARSTVRGDPDLSDYIPTLSGTTPNAQANKFKLYPVAGDHSMPIPLEDTDGAPEHANWSRTNIDFQIRPAFVGRATQIHTLTRTIHEARRETSKMPADTRSAPPGRRRHTHTVCRGGRVSATQ